MTLSIRSRLLVWMSIGMAVLLAAFAVVVYEVMARSLRAGFDGVLASTVNTICGSIEQDEENIKVEIDERGLPEFYRNTRPGYFQVWRDSGQTLARSPSLKGGDLDRIEGTLGSFVFRPVRLPDGRAGRAAGLVFSPKVDEDVRGLVHPQQVTLVVARETAELDSEIRLLEWILGAATSGTILLAMLVCAVVVRRGLRPLDAVASRIAAIGDDDLSVRIRVDPTPREIAPVVERLNELLRRLEEAFHRERAFTADAAHELRTPLAGLQSVLEVSLTRPRASDDYRQAMTECLQIIRSTQTMIDSLLALARLESGQTELHPETILVGEIVEAALRPLTPQAQARGISVETSIPGELACTTDRDKLIRTTTILVGNAVEYTNDGGRIEVTAARRGDSIELRVANTGCGLSEEDAGHVFERFWRGDVSRTDTGVHCGLGLALAQRIVTSLGGTIAASVRGDVFGVDVILPAGAFAGGSNPSA